MTLLSCLTSGQFLDESTEFLFGESMGTLSPETPFATTQFLTAFHYAQRGMGIRIQMGRFRELHRDQKWRDAIKTAHAFADKYVDKALEFRKSYLQQQSSKHSVETENKLNSDTTKRYILLHELAKETDDRIELRSQIIQVFLAGHDSTAITISNA
ncbi:MAG: cytochrome P450, partial [Janthinobacterium lividum]